ncbi:MAG: type III pantothenate kinase [Pelobium sp.]
MSNLVVDIGNSSTKVAVFENDTIVFLHKLASLSEEFLLNLKKQYLVEKAVVSSVKENFGITENFLQQEFEYFRFNRLATLPVKNKYKSPDTLGLDRLAAVIGAKYLFPKENCLVIDAGTCITYDAINEMAVYNGGSISPGIKMRFDAMHQFTAKLPQVAFNAHFEKAFGENTEESMLSGGLNGVLYEAEGFIQQQLKAHQDTKIILCGGDATFFDSRFKNSIFAHLISHEPNLVLIGLNYFVKYQHDHK